METKDVLKKLRNDKGETLSALSKQVGISQPTLSRYESGERKPKYEQLEKLADYFGVSVPYLRGEIDFPNGLSDAELDAVLDEHDLISELGTKAYIANQYSKNKEFTNAILKMAFEPPRSDRENQLVEKQLKKINVIPTSVHSAFLDTLANLYVETMDQPDNELLQVIFETDTVLRALFFPKDATSFDQDTEILHKVFDLVNELRPTLVNSNRNFIYDENKKISDTQSN